MRTLIHGDYVVAFDGDQHRIVRSGVVVYEDDRILHVGRSFQGEVDTQIDASESKLIIPGLVNIHMHAGIQAGGRIVSDVGRRELFNAGYLNYAVAGQGKRPTPEDSAIGARLTVWELLRTGSTTVVNVGGSVSMVEEMARVAGEAGLRAYLGPGYTAADLYYDQDGLLRYDWDEGRGMSRLAEAATTAQAINGTYNGRIQGMLFPNQVDACSPDLLRATRKNANELGLGIQTHVAQNLLEFHEVLRRYGVTPVELLHQTGILGPDTILGHCILTTGHPWLAFPRGNDLVLIADAGASVAHCPLALARRGSAMHSFSKYLGAGINMSIGTDTFPRDMLTEMRLASLFCKTNEGNATVATAKEVFDAATLGGAKALRRADLGRLAAGAKADILIIDLAKPRIGAILDPIKTLVDCCVGEDVTTVVIDGQKVVENGRALGFDEGRLVREVQKAAEAYWSAFPNWDVFGRGVDEVSPQSLDFWKE